MLFHVPEERKLCAGPVQVLAGTVDLKIHIAFQVVGQETEAVFQRHDAGTRFQGKQFVPGNHALQLRQESPCEGAVFGHLQMNKIQVLFILGGAAGTDPDGITEVIGE